MRKPVEMTLALPLLVCYYAPHHVIKIVLEKDQYLPLIVMGKFVVDEAPCQIAMRR